MKLKIASSNPRVTCSVQEFKFTSNEFISTSYELKFTSYEFKFTTYKFKLTSYDFRFMSCEFKSTNCKFKSIELQVQIMNCEFTSASSKNIKSMKTRWELVGVWTYLSEETYRVYVSFNGCARYIFASLFLSLNESTCQTMKNVFYFTLKALFVLEKINF